MTGVRRGSSDLMTEILEFIHHYANDENEQATFGGDQLTVERANGVQRLRKTAATKRQRLSCVLPITEDWHTMMTALIVSFPSNKYWLKII